MIIRWDISYVLRYADKKLKHRTIGILRMKKALITGITGQDGTYLAEHLINEGYEVSGLMRRTSGGPPAIIERLHLKNGLKLISGNVRDLATVRMAMEEVKPDEVYNLAAQSHVGVSFKCPDETWDTNYYGVGRVVNEALKANPNVRIYQASTSEMFGSTPSPQNEQSPFNPVSPYAESKLRAHEDFISGYRNDRGTFACSGILFNHESPRRGKQFVTRKITYSLAKIKLGMQDCLELGNLNAKRDWGYAKEYVELMYAMLQHDTPDDYVIATGEAHTVRDFVDAAAAALDMSIVWEGEGIHELGRDSSGKVIVKINPEFYRPNEVNDLRGDFSKAKSILGWEPKVAFSELVRLMAAADYDELSRHAI